MNDMQFAALPGTLPSLYCSSTINKNTLKWAPPDFNPRSLVITNWWGIIGLWSTLGHTDCCGAAEVVLFSGMNVQHFLSTLAALKRSILLIHHSPDVYKNMWYSSDQYFQNKLKGVATLHRNTMSDTSDLVVIEIHDPKKYTQMVLNWNGDATYA